MACLPLRLIGRAVGSRQRRRTTWVKLIRSSLWTDSADLEFGKVGGIITPMRLAHLRVARATDNLQNVVRFYRDALGFEVLGSFEGHDGFDGVMLGHPGAGYHLEFTHQRGEHVGRAPTQENLLVFYLPDRAEWRRAIEQLEQQGNVRVVSANPYWDSNGATFEDPDGYRVVLQNAAWKK